MRNAKSASDGRNLTATCERASIFSTSQGLSGHPRTGGWPDGFIRSNPVVERPEIHIVDTQGNQRKFLGGIGNPHDRALTVDAFLAEPVIGRQLYFDGDHLADGRNRKFRVVTTPRNQDAASTDVFRIHGALHPKRGRRHMAPEPDFDPRALASIYVLHFFCFDTAEFSSPREAQQCRK